VPRKSLLEDGFNLYTDETGRSGRNRRRKGYSVMKCDVGSDEAWSARSFIHLGRIRCVPCVTHTTKRRWNYYMHIERKTQMCIWETVTLTLQNTGKKNLPDFDGREIFHPWN
jgi:hypothetical protein